jgi:hypothetical protein
MRALIPKLLEVFRNMINFYGEELLAARPTPKLEDYPLSAVRYCLFNILAAILHFCKPFLHSQPEDAPCRGDRDPLITVTWTHLSRWLGPTCHGDRGPLVTVTGPTCHGDGGQLVTVTGAHSSRWLGPTCHGDWDPLVTVTGTHWSRMFEALSN